MFTNHRFLQKDKQNLEKELTQGIQKSDEDLKSLQITQNYLHRNVEESEKSLQEIMQQFQRKI